MDDGNLAGKVKHVAQALKTLVKEGKKIGPVLGLEKCELFYPSGSNFKRGLFPLDLKVMKQGITMIGALIGSVEYTTFFFQRKKWKCNFIE